MKTTLFLLALFSATLGTAETITLGAIAALTGAAGEQGKSWLEGAQLAAEKLNAEGMAVKLVVEDDGTIPMKAATAFNKLSRVNKVQGVIGGTWDYLAQPIFPLAKQHRVPFFTPSNPPEILTAEQQSNPYIFVAGLSLAAERKAIKQFFDQRGVKSLSVVTVDVPFGTMHGEMIKDIAAAENISVLDYTTLPVEGFMSVLKLAAAKVNNLKPDLVFIVTDAGGLDLFTRELSALKSQAVVLSTQHVLDAYRLSNDLERFRKVYGVYPEYERKEFDSLFLKRFNHEPRVYAANGYDAVMFMVEAIKKKLDFSNPSAAFSYGGLTGDFKLPAPTRAVVTDRAVIMGFDRGFFAPAQ